MISKSRLNRRMFNHIYPWSYGHPFIFNMPVKRISFINGYIKLRFRKTLNLRFQINMIDLRHYYIRSER